MRQLAEMGAPVLSETPPAVTVEKCIRCGPWRNKGRIRWQAILAATASRRPAGLCAQRVDRRVSQAQVSAAHGYHGISLMRRYLGVGGELPAISARRFTSPIVEGPGRQGPPSHEKVIEAGQTFTFFDFGDRLGVIDFTGEQYFSWIRGQRLLVRGERGEIVDDRAVYLQDYRTPIYVAFTRHSAGVDGNLEGNYLKGIQAGGRWWYVNPMRPAELSDDEIAVADLLLRMADYVNGGEVAYSLAEACQDRYLDILAAQALERGKPVTAEVQPWTES